MADKLETWTNIPFAKTPQRELRLDLRVPDRESKPPLIVYIPMAGMRDCIKTKMPWWMVDYGYAMACIECRNSSEVIAPLPVHDCKSAVRWLRAHADQYGYRADSIGVWGHSAGGLLAALLGTSGGVAELEGDGPHQGVSSKVQAVCDECGAPHDLAWFVRPDIKSRYAAVTENLRLYLGGPVEERLELARLVSPRTYISSSNPPFLLFHGDADRIVPVEETIEFHEALRSASVDSTLRILAGVGHTLGELTRDDVVKFFDRTLKQITAS